MMMLLAVLLVSVRTPAGIVKLPLENYVAGVVAGESSVFQSDEALKAMAVAARTYAVRMKGRHANEGFDFCSTTHCQRYVSPSERAERAAHATAGEMLWFQGEPAFTVYSRACGGRTEDVSAVWPDVKAPYLISHGDPYCSDHWAWKGSPEQIRRALLQAGMQVPTELHSITVLHRTASGRAQMLSLDGVLISASAFHFAIGRTLGWNTIRSDFFSTENFVFRGSGEGHGIGLCQQGADEMGRQGKSYRQILEFYYPGSTLRPTFEWTQLSGEGVTLYTLSPDSDRVLIGLAEDISRRWHGRLPWPAPPNIEIYVYPDLDSFRNSTGEPGWVAARTTGSKIELQPTQVLTRHDALASTLEHEIIHVYVEHAARPGLPVWFREGLVEDLSGHTSPATPVGNDHEIRQRENRTDAERGYESAAARVQLLQRRYGEAAVLTWVVRGIPADVTNSAPRNPAVNNK